VPTRFGELARHGAFGVRQTSTARSTTAVRGRGHCHCGSVVLVLCAPAFLVRGGVQPLPADYTPPQFGGDVRSLVTRVFTVPGAHWQRPRWHGHAYCLLRAGSPSVPVLSVLTGCSGLLFLYSRNSLNSLPPRRFRLALSRVTVLSRLLRALRCRYATRSTLSFLPLSVLPECAVGRRRQATAGGVRPARLQRTVYVSWFWFPGSSLLSAVYPFVPTPVTILFCLLRNLFASSLRFGWYRFGLAFPSATDPTFRRRLGSLVAPPLFSRFVQLNADLYLRVVHATLAATFLPHYGYPAFHSLLAYGLLLMPRTPFTTVAAFPFLPFDSPFAFLYGSVWRYILERLFGSGWFIAGWFILRRCAMPGCLVC